jgi:hypothetical protein
MPTAAEQAEQRCHGRHLDGVLIGKHKERGRRDVRDPL